MPDAPPRPWPRRLLGLLRGALVFGITLLTGLFLIQERMIFHPGGSDWSTPPDGERVELELADGTRVVALWGPALQGGAPVADPRAHPSALFCYGNGARLATSVGAWRAFRNMGVNLLAFDYPGYGGSGGKASEASIREAATVALAALRARPEVDPGRVLALGHSLGGAVAIDLASREPLAGLVALSTFTSMEDMAWERFRVPRADLLLRHHFRSAEKLPGITVPTFLAHGTVDGVVPFEMLDRLRTVAGGPLTVVVAPGAGHDVLGGEEGAPVRRALRAWLRALPPR